ncbi:MAG: hypothetical protein AAGB26_04085 [Planctomycetota bacterium]
MGDTGLVAKNPQIDATDCEDNGLKQRCDDGPNDSGAQSGAREASEASDVSHAVNRLKEVWTTLSPAARANIIAVIKEYTAD